MSCDSNYSLHSWNWFSTPTQIILHASGDWTRNSRRQLLLCGQQFGAWQGQKRFIQKNPEMIWGPPSSPPYSMDVSGPFQRFKAPCPDHLLPRLRMGGSIPPVLLTAWYTVYYRNIFTINITTISHICITCTYVFIYFSVALACTWLLSCW